MYSETQHQNINLTSWYKPWPPEIDWLDSYVNLSSYHPIVLEGLTVGYRTTIYAKYFTSSEWGCLMMFPMDADLVDSYYLEHYGDTNDTKYICTPYIPVRPDLRKKMAETLSSVNYMIRCNIYQLRFLKRLYQVHHWSYVFTADYPVVSHIYNIVIVLIGITGLLGEFHPSPSISHSSILYANLLNRITKCDKFREISAQTSLCNCML